MSRIVMYGGGQSEPFHFITPGNTRVDRGTDDKSEIMWKRGGKKREERRGSHITDSI